jgi:hypothetical protein
MEVNSGIEACWQQVVKPGFAVGGCSLSPKCSAQAGAVALTRPERWLLESLDSAPCLEDPEALEFVKL